MNSKVLIYSYLYLLTCFLSSILTLLTARNSIRNNLIGNISSIVGSQVNIDSYWIGTKPVKKNISILLLAGHADSQGIAGKGTLGEAVAIRGETPMNSEISDELFWNLKLLDVLLILGKKRGLNIQSYIPPIRNILDPNDPITNWSVGAKHALKGGYPIEIHFDAYGKYGIGSGLIPPVAQNINTVDEALANRFGRFPLFFRGGLGAPRRQIRVLEVGKLEGKLERNLRNLSTREQTLRSIAMLIVQAIVDGLKEPEFFNPLPDKGDIFLPGIYL